jgi:hypothetical protein
MTAVAFCRESEMSSPAPALRGSGPPSLAEAPFAGPSIDCHGRLFAMQRAFRHTGGIITGDSLAALLRRHCDQPLSLLARWIVHREVVNFEAHGQTWLPMFQFDFGGAGVNTGVRQIMAELGGVFDDWELTDWFATPNTWLGGASPADAMAGDVQAVLQAARADRFVAVG